MEAGRLFSYPSRVAWAHQPQVSVTCAQKEVPLSLRRCTLSERCARDRPTLYGDEGQQDLCELCYVPLLSSEQHNRGSLHQDRVEQQRLQPSERSRPLTTADVEAALIIVCRSCQERLRAKLHAPPELGQIRLSDAE